MVVELLAMDAMWAALHVLHLFNHDLLLGQVLLLPCHKILLFLLPSLKCILLLSCQGGTKAWEATSERRLS